MTPFLILTMPRSRSYWASKFLALNGRKVEHNPFVAYGSLDEIVGFFESPGAAAVDPAAGAIWRDLLPRIPHVRIAVIRRPVADVVVSLQRIGTDAPFLPRLVARYAEELNALAASGQAEVFEFDRLSEPAHAAALFEHCTGEPLDSFWWQVMRDRNLQSPEIGRPQTLIGPIGDAMRAFVKDT
jgi:hypothetical protein